jgi:hypothetical protein
LIAIARGQPDCGDAGETGTPCAVLILPALSLPGSMPKGGRAPAKAAFGDCRSGKAKGEQQGPYE